jgi:hypothetical protein
MEILDALVDSLAEGVPLSPGGVAAGNRDLRKTGPVACGACGFTIAQKKSLRATPALAEGAHATQRPAITWLLLPILGQHGEALILAMRGRAV